MTTLDNVHTPILSRPRVAALAMTIGASAMAFGVYTAENSMVHNSTAVHAVPAPAAAAVVQNVDEAPMPAVYETPTINLGEMRIDGSVTHSRSSKPSISTECTPSWRSLDTGPETQKVRDLCAASASPSPKLTINPISRSNEHLALPRTHFSNLGAIESPAKIDSLSNLLPEAN